jgi:hypothetical protein
MALVGTLRDGKLIECAGKVDMPSLQLAERTAKNLRCDLIKPADCDGVQLGKLQAQLAGGELAGQVDLAHTRSCLHRRIHW